MRLFLAILVIFAVTNGLFASGEESIGNKSPVVGANTPGSQMPGTVSLSRSETMEDGEEAFLVDDYNYGAMQKKSRTRAVGNISPSSTRTTRNWRVAQPKSRPRLVRENLGHSPNPGLRPPSQSPSNRDSLGDRGQDLGKAEGFGTTQQGALDGTSDAQNKGSQVQIMGLAMGTAFASQCGRSNKFACVAAVMSFADALKGGLANQNAYKTGIHFDAKYQGGYDPNQELNDMRQAQAEDGLKNLAEMGYTPNKDGSVTMSNGQSVTAKELSSLQALTGKGGMSPQGATQFIGKANAIKAVAAKKAGINLGVEEQQQVYNTASGRKGSGFGQAAAPARFAAPKSIVEDVEVKYRGRRKKKNRLPASQAAQLSKNFNGDPIGIGMADLFLIVHQKYRERKNKGGEFIRREY